MPHSVYVFRGVHLPQSVDRSVAGLDFSTPPFFSDVSVCVIVKVCKCVYLYVSDIHAMCMHIYDNRICVSMIMHA